VDLLCAGRAGERGTGRPDEVLTEPLLDEAFGLEVNVLPTRSPAPARGGADQRPPPGQRYRPTEPHLNTDSSVCATTVVLSASWSSWERRTVCYPTLNR
jgi:hypothetical protein